ncbi:MAG: LacI family DNA-binding transcriptional regulator [Chloroflexi bacterium]|nr:LacI family DNA-binding transcriptional regulator [Chloroflexota bacterium]
MANQRVTARDVARRAGVSATTVSFVLNNVEGMRISEETRARVLEAAKALDYHPDSIARRMVTGQTQNIAYVIRQNPEQAFADAFMPQVLHGLAQGAATQDFHVLFEPIGPEDSRGFAWLMRERHVDGMVISGPRTDDPDLLELLKRNFPVVLQGQLPGAQIPFVDVDNQQGARVATQHLISLGHRRIGTITNAGLNYTAAAARLAGYREALTAADIPVEENLIRYGNFTPQSGEAAIADLLKEKPTAIFVASDVVALGTLNRLQALGMRVPDDVALVGFDDIPLARYLDPPLTTMRLPAFGLGWGAAELITRFINRVPVENPQVLLETELIVRESCGGHL